MLGFLKSCAYSYPDSSPWSTEQGKRVTKHITVSITYQVIHDAVPSWFQTVDGFGEEFYGITGPVESLGVGTGDDGIKHGGDTSSATVT